MPFDRPEHQDHCLVAWRKPTHWPDLMAAMVCSSHAPSACGSGIMAGGAKEKEFPRPFALFSPLSFLEGKGITACSQQVLGTLTCLFPA